MQDGIVITGIGMVTPLGAEPEEVLRRVTAGETAAAAPTGFAGAAFGCPVCAVVKDFDPLPSVTEPKLARLMNRDAQLAVAAARRALRDAKLCVGHDYAADEIGLFGATGMAGLPLNEVTPLLQASVTADGRFDPQRFGGAGLRAVSPILSFKILGNMPLCFVGINEGIRGPNAIYTPWEGHGAQAIEAGMRALQSGEARCAVVGGCDVKTHELAFLGLAQQGVFASWREHGSGVVPGEGAVFLVLETQQAAAARGARVHAQLTHYGLCTHPKDVPRAETYARAIRACHLPDGGNPARPTALISAANGDPAVERDETTALSAMHLNIPATVRPKLGLGDLFAAAAFAQVALASLLARQSGGRVLANCFGRGSEQAAFLLEAL